MTSPVYVVRDAVTLNPILVTLNKEEARSVCRDGTDAFVDEFVLGQMRTNASVFNDTTNMKLGESV